MSTSAPTVALLGTGTMGAGMARQVAAAGLDLRVWNRTRTKAEPLADVAHVCDTPAEAVEGADVVVTVLHDADACADTLRQAGDALAADAVWVQCSTVGVEGTARLVALAGELGVAYLDAPVLGTRKPAEDGTLVVLAAGPSSLRPSVDPVLEAMGSRTLWVGEEPGASSRLKLACNAWVLTVVEGVAESLAMTRALGLDPALFLEAVSGSAVESPYVGLKGKAMLADGEIDPDFALSGGLKDLGLMVDAVAATDFEPRLLPALHDQFAAAVDQGYGDQDLAATYRTFATSSASSAMSGEEATR